MNTKKHDVPEELLSGLLANYKKPEDLIGENGLLKQLTKLLVERALDAELTEHLGHERNEAVANPAGNTRNGKSKKTLKGEFGELPIEVPRDRHGSFEPQLIPKHQTRWAGFDDKIISLYARGMTVREIQAHLEEMYGTEVSPSLISSVTDAVADEVKAWQARPLEPIYPIVYLDCIHVKVREGAVRVKAVYLAIGITMTGDKEVLGLWLAQTEGAKFWLQVVTELRNRGVQDIFIACVDGLKGFPDAIEAVFPQAVVQLCIVHMVRHSLNYVSWKRRKEVAADLRRIYTATTAEEAELMLGPVLPHPSRDPRRGDRLLIEYKEPLFDVSKTPLTNVLYAHESNPFEAYRQLLGAMKRYQKSLSVIGGCRLVVTPLASKLITLGAALACYEMKLDIVDGNYGVAIPYAEPKRYSVSTDALRASTPEVSAMVLTGEAYA